MIKLIKAITPIDDANGMHSTFKTRSNQITYLFQVEFVDGDNGRCGSINTTPPYEAGDRVEANVVKETKDSYKKTEHGGFVFVPMLKGKKV